MCPDAAPGTGIVSGALEDDLSAVFWEKPETTRVRLTRREMICGPRRTKDIISFFNRITSSRTGSRPAQFAIIIYVSFSYIITFVLKTSIALMAAQNSAINNESYYVQDILSPLPSCKFNIYPREIHSRFSTKRFPFRFRVVTIHEHPPSYTISPTSEFRRRESQ